jgi:pimeloyl-ACP methyl ester carboxylesterase
MLLAHADNGPGPVVVLLHGFPLDRTMWAGQVGDVGSVYRLITPDLRGFGYSAAPDEPATIDAMADDVIETLDALGLSEPVVLGGLSMGGYVALSAALRYPARFRALMLLDTKAAPDTAEAAEVRHTLARQIDESGDFGPVADGMVPRLFSPVTRQTRPELIEPLLAVMRRTVPRAASAALRAMAARPDRRGDLARITMPTLVLVGSDDVISPPDEARSIASALPDARLDIIPGAGHLAPVEKQTETNRAILTFLQSLRD